MNTKQKLENMRKAVAGIKPRPKTPNDFQSFGDFAMAVKRASAAGGQIDPRLVGNAAPSTFGSEGVGTDGGFAVPPDFKKDIMTLVQGEESLLSMTDMAETDGNTLYLPTDETTAWGTGGIQAYWEGEGKQFTQSKPNLQNNTIRLNKLTALVPVTEEVYEDAPSLDFFLRKKAPEKINFKVNDALINGSGVGMPLGILNAPATVSVTKESGQAADTVVAMNLLKMWARLYGPSRRNAVWLYNQDIETQLMTAAIAVKNVAGTENVGGFPVYLPPGGLSSTPYATLFGRPMIPTQGCKTLGDKGDIMVADLKQYLTAVKTRGIRQEMSIHLWFDYDIVAFKFVMRVAGQPWLSAPISPKSGNNTMSPFVTLDERG